MIETACPSRETLLRYLQGNFDFSQIDSLEEHVEQCPNCEDTVAELEDTNDTLMRHLPLAAIDKVEADAERRVWIERLKAGPPTRQEEQSDERMVDGQGESVANGWADGLTSYELLEVLGKGGMGVVYRGRHRQLGRPVAVKVVRPKLVSAAEAHRRFDREIRILGGLNHPGIVMATDAGRVGPAAYLVMELIDGVDLARLVRSAGPLDVGEACEVAQQIAVALSAAHAAGAVHRDVKPSNVMIDNTGRVKLLDFGLACLIELSGDHGETSLGRLIGTLDYMAPEQAEGIGVQASADLYGLGATLFYLLAGRPPHASDHNRTLLGQLKALSCEDPPHLADLRLDVPEELSNLVAKLLARNPADRPETAALVADRLATWADPDAKRALAEMIPAVDRSDDVQAAARSLAELVGRDPEERASKPTEKEQTAANGSGRRIGHWLLGVAGFAGAAALGIVLLVETSKGTLRIELEAENVQVELVDEADRTKTVQIEAGGNAKRGEGGDSVKRPDKPVKVPDPTELEVTLDDHGRVPAFSFAGQSWPDVMQWLANLSKQSLDWQELPNDYLNLSTRRSLSVDEVRDLINRTLHARGYTILVRDGVMSVFKLAGKHDNLSLTPGAIELRRGEERLARITHLPPDGSEQKYAAGGSRPDEPEMRAINEELTRVTIPVEYEDGRPATGAEVTMRMQGNPERPVVVTGKADAHGVAFNRNLPYGKYEMTIKVPDGDTAYWSATFYDILLEFGGSFEQKVVAPTPEKRATVKVQTAFNPAGLKGLRFGGFSGRQGDFSVGIVWSPEPGTQDDRFARFPVLGNGISKVAVYMTMRVTRDVKQPSGGTLNWYWMRRGDFYPDVILTDEGVIDIKEIGWDGNVVYNIPESEYFSDAPEMNGVQYFTFHDWQRLDNPLLLELPPGKLECEVRSFFGKATREVIQALDLEPQAGREVWLEARLNAESAWVPRGIDRSDWSPGKDIHNVLGYKTFSLKPGETQAIRVASPDLSSVDRSETKEPK